MLRRIRTIRQTPAPVPAPAPAPSLPPSRLDQLLGRFGLPGVLIRQFMIDFRELQPWWPILIPAIVFVAARTYRHERALVLLERQARAAQARKQQQSG